MTRRTLIIGSLIIAITALLYGASYTFDFINLDDGLLVFHDPVITTLSFKNIITVFTSLDPKLYIPLTRLTYQMEYALVGKEAALFHIDNVVLHIANALLVFALLMHLLKKQWIAAFGALLFALHPIHTDTIMWISARKDLLFTFFYLATLVLWTNSLSPDQGERVRGRGKKKGGLLFFLLALLSKPTAVTLPFILILLEWYKTGTIDNAVWKRLKPYFALSATFVFIALLGKSTNVDALSLFSIFLLSAKSTLLFLYRLFVPTDLAVFYPYNGSTNVFNLFLMYWGLLGIGITAVATYSLRWTRDFFFSWMFFLITLLPIAAALVHFETTTSWHVQLAANRHVYLASIGIIFLLAKNVGQITAKKWYVMTCCVITLLFFASLSRQRVLLWQNSETLFTDFVEDHPDSFLGYWLLGLDALENNDQERAKNLFIISSELKPDFSRNYLWLGYIAGNNGDTETSRTYLDRSLELEPDLVQAKQYRNLLN